MFTETVSAAFAAQIETSEVNAWLDMYAAIPSDFARQFGFTIKQVQNVVLTICKPIPFVHFNCIKNLGINLGARYFVADIEAPTPQMDTPAYHNFAALGFKRPYFRSHYNN